MTFPFTKQPDSMDCGPACLSMISEHYGKRYTLEYLRENCFIGHDGVSLLGISRAAEKIGFHTVGGRLTFDRLAEKAPLPCIVHWNQEHFVVVYGIRKNKKGYKVSVADPGKGLLSYSRDEFCDRWVSTRTGGEEKGVTLLLEPTQLFYEQEGDCKPRENRLKFLWKYLLKYKRFFAQLILGLFMGSILQLIFPFLTQAIVDTGIQGKDIGFVWLVLIAQMMLLFSRTAIDFIRRKILLHISTRINVSLISDFFIKLMKLPMKFFDTKLTGDLLQRIEDHRRIENFLTNQTITVLFSAFTFAIFSVVLFIYNVPVFAVFLAGSILYGLWIMVFLKKRRILDYRMFEQQGINRNVTYQLITGMQEIKLQGCEQRKRWEWEDVQAGLFDVNLQSLNLRQGQEAGGILINELKNILVTVLAATAVVGASGSGKPTLVKLLLGYYAPDEGRITVGTTGLEEVNLTWWRTQCGAVMQDGYLFSDTIARNIAVAGDEVEVERLRYAARIANIAEDIERLPLGYNTKIGQDGQGVSQGQRQRILIARVVYKNPPFIFLDEATNSLDANNERAIVDNLEAFYRDKTVVVVAHRLSTVKNADRIVVLDAGKMAETGTHEELTRKRGKYYELVRNQLELGN